MDFLYGNPVSFYDISDMEARMTDTNILTGTRIEQLKDFIIKSKIDDEANKRELFQSSFNMTEDVLEDMLFFGIARYDQPVEKLKQQLNKIEMLEFEKLIVDELSTLQREYPTGQPIKYHLFIMDEDDAFGREKLGGVSAFTEWNGEMGFVVYPDESVKRTLRSVINHEFHHHWRMQNTEGLSEQTQNLLDRLILEGLAEHFVGERLGTEYYGLFTHQLSESEAKVLWESVYKINLSLKGEATNPYMFGDEDLDIPHWAGYSLGFHLVQSYVQAHPELNIETLTTLPPNDFLKGV